MTIILSNLFAIYLDFLLSKLYFRELNCVVYIKFSYVTDYFVKKLNSVKNSGNLS